MNSKKNVKFALETKGTALYLTKPLKEEFKKKLVKEYVESIKRLKIDIYWR
jgi:hypothetical protein